MGGNSKVTLGAYLYPVLTYTKHIIQLILKILAQKTCMCGRIWPLTPPTALNPAASNIFPSVINNLEGKLEHPMNQINLVATREVRNAVGQWNVTQSVIIAPWVSWAS